MSLALFELLSLLWHLEGQLLREFVCCPLIAACLGLPLFLSLTQSLLVFKAKCNGTSFPSPTPCSSAQSLSARKNKIYFGYFGLHLDHVIRNESGYKDMHVFKAVRHSLVSSTEALYWASSCLGAYTIKSKPIT